MLVNGSSSAQRQDGPHVYYTKRTAWTPQWCMCNLFCECFQFCPPGAQKTFFSSLAQLTDTMDPMYIIPKEPPEPHNNSHIICFFECFQFRPPGAHKKVFFLALAHITDKMDPKYIIPKVLSEPHDDAHVICFLVFPILATRGLKNSFFWL